MNAVRATFTVAATALLFGMSTGCSSISGHKLIPCEDGSGRVRLQDVEGLPIVVKQPKTAVFVLTEKEFLVEREDPATGRKETLPNQTETTISEKPIMLGPYDVYTIDTLRPAAGSIDYEIALQDQYPSTIKGKVVDTTLTDAGKVAGDLIDKFGLSKKVDKQEGANVTRTLIRTNVRLVVVDLATGQFRIEDLSAKETKPGS